MKGADEMGILGSTWAKLSIEAFGGPGGVRLPWANILGLKARQISSASRGVTSIVRNERIEPFFMVSNLVLTAVFAIIRPGVGFARYFAEKKPRREANDNAQIRRRKAGYGFFQMGGKL